MLASSGEITPPCGVPATVRSRPARRSSHPPRSHCRPVSAPAGPTPAARPRPSDRSWSIVVEEVPDVGLEPHWVYPSMNATRIVSIACVADRFGRNPYEHRQEVGLENGFQHDLRRLPAPPGRAPWESPTVGYHLSGFGMSTRLRRRGTIRPRTKIALELTRASAPPRTPPPPPRSPDRPRPRPDSLGPAPTPPTARHLCGYGHTGRGNADPQTAWPQPIAALQFSHFHRRRSPVQGYDRPMARRGSWTGRPRPCPHAYPLHRHDQSRGPSLPARYVARRSPVLRPRRTPAALRSISPSAYTDRSLARQGCADGSLLFRTRPCVRAAPHTPEGPTRLTPEQGLTDMAFAVT